MTILCGLTRADIVKVASERPMNQREAAKRLGCNYAHFNQVMKREGMTHLFTTARRRCISREDVVKAAQGGLCQTDTAEILGISRPYLTQLIAEWGLRDLFPFPRKQRI